MKITFLTAGTGSYHCGACMRDNTLVTALHRDGHEVALLPLYLPMTLDEEVLPQVKRAPIFFGGINVFLQQKLAFFRHTPKWFDRLLNGAGLLRGVAKRSHLTSARAQGEMTLAMLRVEESRLTKELDKLIDWLEHHEKPDVVCLSNALLAGLTRELKRRLDVRVIACFQGEDSFLDSLPEPFREQCWNELKERLPEADLLVSPSRFYADLMAERLDLSADRIEVLPNGINLEGYGPATSDGPPVIGYFARMTREKGLGTFVDAFIAYREAAGPGEGRARARIAGTCTKGDEKEVEALKRKLEKAGLAAEVDWQTNLSREEKVEFLRGLTLFSVPVEYPEAFGLYLVEALASGVPVVQPDASSFPEIVAATGGGVLVPPGDPGKLAAEWARLLSDPAELLAMGERGRRGAQERYSVEAMKDGFVTLAEQMLGGKTSADAGGEPEPELIS